jgi:hypothetical protein
MKITDNPIYGIELDEYTYICNTILETIETDIGHYRKSLTSQYQLWLVEHPNDVEESNKLKDSLNIKFKTLTNRLLQKSLNIDYYKMYSIGSKFKVDFNSSDYCIITNTEFEYPDLWLNEYNRVTIKNIHYCIYNNDDNNISNNTMCYPENNLQLSNFCIEPDLKIDQLHDFIRSLI